MPDPMPKPEMPVPQQIVVGETPLYLSTPLTIAGKEVSSVIIRSADKRGISGIESSVLLVGEPSRKKGDEGKIIDKPVLHVDTMDQMSWDKISGIQWTDETGVTHIIPKEELTLTPPEKSPSVGPAETTDLGNVSNSNEIPLTVEPTPTQPETAAASEIPTEQPEVPPEPTPPAPTPSKEARKVLETLTEDPNTITIVGLRAYETRALDLADRAMQKLGGPRLQERAEATKNLWDKTKDSLKNIDHFVSDTIWKQSIGGIYFHERARQYYLDMITAAETPFAEQSIRLAEARATEAYNKKLADSNFIKRIGTKAWEALKDTVGARTAIQTMALEEIGVMKAAGELTGAEVFEREAKAVRMRFGADMDKVDQFVRTQLGEKLEILDPTKEEHKPLVEGIQGLLKQYATGEITDRADFDKRTKEFFNATLKNVRPDIFAEAELYSSSLFESAEMLRTKMSHEAGLANIDEAIAGMQIRLGIGAMGEVTSLEPTAVERGIGRVREVFEWLNKQNVIVPMVFNEGTIGTGVAIALSATNLFKTMPARIFGGIGGGALAGGIFAGWKEYGQLQKDYLTHLRERETGAQFTETMKRRAWFERFSVKQRSATEMMGTIQTSLYDGDVLKTTLTDDELRSTFATVADLQARKAVSETGPKRIGLVQYTSREAIETERAALDIVANKALVDLDTYLSAHTEQATNVLGGNTFPDFMVKLTTNQTQVLKQGVGVMESFDDPIKATLGLVSQYAPEADMIKRRWPFAGRDTTPDEKTMGMDAILSEFNKEARFEAVKYGVRAGVIGAAVGVTIHAIGDLNAALHATPIGQTASTTVGHATSTATLPPETVAQPVEIGTPHQVPVDGIIGTNGEQVHAMLPPGFTLQHMTPTGHPDSWELLGPDKQILASGLHFNHDGTLTDSTAVNGQLATHGLGLSTQQLPVEQVAQPIPAVPVESGGTVTGETMTIHDNELGNGGIWDYFLGKSHGENSVATANGMKNLFRLYEQQHGTGNITFGENNANPYHHIVHLREATLGPTHVTNDIDLNRIANDANISLPKDVFGQHGIDQFTALNDKAITDYQHLLANDTSMKGPMDAINALYNSNDPTKHLEGIVLKMGYLGHDGDLPTDPKDVNLLMEKLGATIQAGPIESPITTTIPATPMHQIVISPVISGVAHVGSGITPDLPNLTPSPLPENIARAAAADKLPWFPVFIPFHEALEMAPVETVAAVVQPGEVLLSPFGMEETFLTKDAIEARKSPKLTENPEAILNQSEEIVRYLGTLSEEEATALAELVAQHDTPISPDVRLIVSMPVSQAGGTIYQRLSAYTKQTNADGTPLNPKQTEFVVFDAVVGEPNGELNNTTKTEIERFTTEHPDMHVVYLTRTYAEAPPVGRIKRDMSNYILSRIATLPADNPDVSIVTDNGSGSTLSPTYLSNMLTTMETNPAIDMVTGAYHLPQEAYANYPLLFAQHRAFELFDALARHGESGSVPGVYSGNTGVRAATLAAVGGYNPTTTRLDERELSWIIRSARGNTPDHTMVSPELTVTIDPKETVYAHLQQLGLADANIPLAKNETFNTLSWQDIAQKASDAYTNEQFEADLTNMYQNLYPTLKSTNPTRFDAYFKRTMDALGVQYEITDGTVHILDTASLPANMTAEIDMEAFAKQTSAEVVAATPIEPASARESLENLAGPADLSPEASAKGEMPAETVASTIASPEVTATEPTTPTEQALPQVEQLPEGVEDRVNYVLNKTKESTAAVDITSGELMDYLKSRLEMAGGTRITDGNIQVQGDAVTMTDMKAKSFVGDVHFNGTLVADPQKGLVVDMNTVHYDLPLLMRIFEGRIKNQLGNLNDTLLLHMSQRIPANWKAERIDVVGEKIEVKFSKKSTA